jgi:hypothetical protein
LSKLQVVVGGGGGGGGGGVTLVGGTMTVLPLESLPPPPHAETPAANISMILFNERFFIT